MVDSPDPIKHSSPQAPLSKTPMTTDKTDATDSYHAQYSASSSANSFLKRMFPEATHDQINQIFDLWMKTIATAIQQNQKFHEEQRQIRKEESGDEDEM